MAEGVEAYSAFHDMARSSTGEPALPGSAASWKAWPGASCASAATGTPGCSPAAQQRCLNPSYARTGLTGWLRQRGVSTLFVCGVATEFCVRATVLDSLAEGFATVLLTDAGATAKASTAQHSTAVVAAASGQGTGACSPPAHSPAVAGVDAAACQDAVRDMQQQGAVLMTGAELIGGDAHAGR